MSHPTPHWLEQRPGETRDDWLTRQFRSCFHCPHPVFDTAIEADDHEVECARRTPEQRQALLADAIRHQGDKRR